MGKGISSLDNQIKSLDNNINMFADHEIDQAPLKEGFVRPDEKQPKTLMERVAKIFRGEGGLPMPIEYDKDGEYVHVLETRLPVKKAAGKLVPPPEAFQHFTLDQRTLDTIEKVATAVELQDPCLLEGETSTSKTSSIEFLAMISNNDIVRLNLNGQTDTSELIGKYVPNDGQLKIAFEQLLKTPDILSEQSRNIIERANTEGRGLSLLESQKIASIENINVPDWCWQDGIIPLAMKNGQWVILDEINLAEPQILERLNSVLERNPNLTLSEMGNQRIGKGGETSTHPDFRIFATMNPAEYAGREPMSPAYKDRWTSYKYVENPSMEDYQSMMELMVFGEQPEVEVRGVKYQGKKSESMYGRLATVPGMREFLVRVAKLQVELEQLAKKQVIGKDKKEPYIFTRRGLIEFLEYMEKKTIVDRKRGKLVSVTDDPKLIAQRALQYYFLDKMSNADDSAKVDTVMGAIGISRGNFVHSFEINGQVGLVNDKEEEILETEIQAVEIGRNAEEFLTDVFIKLKGSSFRSDDAWSWSLGEIDGVRVVDMHASSSDVRERGIDIDKREDFGAFNSRRMGTGINALLQMITNEKKVLSVDYEGRWYLQILD